MKKILSKFTISCFLIALISLLYACGDNIFSNSETADPAEDAAIELENGNPSAAIKILNVALEKDSTNVIYTSLLSLAYAQRAGVEPLLFAQNFAEQTADSDTENSNMFTLMFKVLPDPTVQNLADIKKSLELLNGIAADDRLPGDDFKLAMFNTASAILTLKQFDSNLDGVISVGELTNFNDTTAAALLAQIDAAESLLSGDDSSKDGAAAASSFSTFKTELAKQEGDTDEEKLTNFLSSTNSQ